MTATIKFDVAVGVTDEIIKALEQAAAVTGLKNSVYARLALVARLQSDGFLEKPRLRRRAKAVAAPEIAAE